MKKVLITRRLPAIAKELLAIHFEVIAREENEPIPLSELKLALKEYDAILTTVSDNISADLINSASKIKVISNYAVGLSNIDLNAAKEKGISVYNTPGVVTKSTADFTFALLLSLIRKIPSAKEFVTAGKWSSWDPEIFLGEQLSGKTFGIIGFGEIGQEVAIRARAFGLNVIFHNRSEKSNKDFKQVSFETLLQSSDYISIHVPLNETTEKLISKNEFDKMYKKPILINMARGGVVDTESLVEALEKGKVRGACLDVIDPEPIYPDHPLCDFDNCMIVPHIGTATVECRNDMAELAARNIINHYVKYGDNPNNNSNCQNNGDACEVTLKLKKTFGKVFDGYDFYSNLSMDNFSEWDSLKHIQFITMIERDFEIKLPYLDSLKMISMNNIIDKLREIVDGR